MGDGDVKLPSAIKATQQLPLVMGALKLTREQQR